MVYHMDRRGLLAGLGMAGVAAATPAWAAAPATPFFKRIDKPIGIQLYTMGEASQKDLSGTLSRLSAIGYKEFELPSLYGRSAKDLRAEGDKAGVKFTSIHMSLPARVPPGTMTLMSSPQEIADNLGTLGISKAVLPIPLLPDDWKPGPDMRAALISGIEAGGVDMWKRMGHLLNERAAALQPHGISLGYHNHNMEFRPIGGTTGWAILLKELDPNLVFIELDLGWVTAGGLDPVAELRRLKGRVKMVHLKDVKPTTKTNYALQQDPCEVGQGKLNWHGILPACVAAGVQHYYVEQEPPFAHDRFESVKMSYDFLSRFKG